MSIVPRPKGYKPKGLDNFNPDDYKDILERAAQILEQRRLAEAAATHENDADDEGQRAASRSENGTAQVPSPSARSPLTTHDAQRAPAPK